MPPFSATRPVTYLQVSLCIGQSVVIVGTFNTANTLACHILAMSSILFGKRQEGLNSLLIYSSVSKEPLQS